MKNKRHLKSPAVKISADRNQTDRYLMAAHRCAQLESGFEPPTPSIIKSQPALPTEPQLVKTTWEI